MSESSHHVLSISPLLSKVEIPNSVCVCILGLRSAMYHFWGHCDLDLWPQFLKNRILSISPMLFDIFGCILVLLIVVFYVGVTVTLSSVPLFADDCVLYRNIHSLQDCLILQDLVNTESTDEFRALLI